MIHAALQAENASARVRRRPHREQRIARRAAHAFADSIDDPHRKHLRPRRGECDQRTDRRRYAVSQKHDPPFARRAIGEAARHDLQRAVHGLGCAFDDAERHSGRAENLGQKEREQRVDRLAGRIGGETHPSEEPDWARDSGNG